MAKHIHTTYKLNKEKKVGETCTCPICGDKFIKKQYSQAFCCGHCKDVYHNKRKSDRHRPNYHKEYDMKHPERLERIMAIRQKINDIWWEEVGQYEAMCENPILGI